MNWNGFCAPSVAFWEKHKKIIKQERERERERGKSGVAPVTPEASTTTRRGQLNIPERFFNGFILTLASSDTR